MKKEKKKNMERYKSLFFQSGLLVSLAIVLFAFEWKTFENNNTLISDDPFIEIIDTEVVLPTKNDPEPLKQSFELKLVGDNVETPDLVVDAELKLDEILDFVYYDPELIEVEIEEENSIILVPGVMPEFPGGEEGLFKYLAHNIEYPQAAIEINLQGTVYVTFIIEKDGSVSNVALKRGIGGGCDEEAIRVVKNMPKWIPGKQYGRPVRVQYNLPVKFVLN